jgi:NAD+ synthase
MGLPAAIAERDPTTETFSLPQTQEEFYFGHPYDKMDLLVHGVEEDIAPADLAPLVGMDAEGVASAYDEVRRVRKATSYLHSSARIIDIDGSNHPAGR